MDQTAREEEERIMAAGSDEPVRREGGTPDRFVAHIPIPEDYSPHEVMTFKRLIREALEPVVRDARMDIDTMRSQA